MHASCLIMTNVSQHRTYFCKYVHSKILLSPNYPSKIIILNWIGERNMANEFSRSYELLLSFVLGIQRRHRVSYRNGMKWMQFLPIITVSVIYTTKIDHYSEWNPVDFSKNVKSFGVILIFIRILNKRINQIRRWKRSHQINNKSIFVNKLIFFCYILLLNHEFVASARRFIAPEKFDHGQRIKLHELTLKKKQREMYSTLFSFLGW